MDKVYIFCDEFGTSTLKKNDNKNITKFVYCSIVIKESQIDKARQIRDEISNKFLFGQKIKSSSKRLANNNIRIQCLEYLYSNLKFINHFLIVDKEKLDQDKGGLRFKETFYKYFQKILIGELMHSFSEFEIYFHHTISENYGNEVRDYLERQIKNNIFERYHFSDDYTEPLIQFADLLAGSIGKCFNNDYQIELNYQIFNLIKPSIYSLRFFPEEQKVDSKPIFSESTVDEEISKIVRTDALEEYHNNKDEIIKTILEQLLFYQKVAPIIYLQTYEIINYLKHYYNKDISTETLRLLIRDLRFNGIIIVSANSKSGYKLAVNKADIYHYFNHYSKYILPMLKKVQIANDIFLQKTVGDFNPIKDFEELVKLIDAIKMIKPSSIPNAADSAT